MSLSIYSAFTHILLIILCNGILEVDILILSILKVLFLPQHMFQYIKVSNFFKFIVQMEEVVINLDSAYSISADVVL